MINKLKVPAIFKQSNSINWTKLLLELMVVFLGVSAGFLLQNRKEDSGNRELEQKYIQGFVSDVNLNIEDLREAIEEDSLLLEDTKYAIPLIINDSLSLDSANSLIGRVAKFSEFTAHVITYENITNSGSLNLISKYEMRHQIVEYHKSFEDFKLLELYFRNHISNDFMPFLINRYDIFNQELEDYATVKTLRFHNIFAIHFSLTQQRLEGYKRLLKESEEIKKILEDKE